MFGHNNSSFLTMTEQTVMSLVLSLGSMKTLLLLVLPLMIIMEFIVDPHRYS